MKFLADENMERPVVQWLRDQQMDIEWIAEVAPRSSDLQVIERAKRDGRILITSDLDFGELVIRYQADVSGVILFRWGEKFMNQKLEILSRCWKQACSRLPGHFVVVTEDKIRARPL